MTPPIEFILDHNRHLRQALSKNKLKDEDLLNAINIRYTQIKNQPGKIKPVKGARYRGQPVLEFKVTCKGNRVLRVAYAIQKDNAIIFFASDDIVKAHFSRKLLQTNLVD